eukprot:765980-Hanusia_phi.AAC.2
MKGYGARSCWKVLEVSQPGKSALEKNGDCFRALFARLPVLAFGSLANSSSNAPRGVRLYTNSLRSLLVVHRDSFRDRIGPITPLCNVRQALMDETKDGRFNFEVEGVWLCNGAKD